MLNSIQRIWLTFILQSAQLVAFSQSYADEDDHFIKVEFGQVSMLSITPSNASLTYVLSLPEKAGMIPVFEPSAANQELWLNYTNGVSEDHKSRNISVQIRAGKVPDGIKLFIELDDAAGQYKGAVGRPTGKQEVKSRGDTFVLNGIGGAVTGVGKGNGHKITYEVVPENVDEIEASDGQEINIIFTITDG